MAMFATNRISNLARKLWRRAFRLPRKAWRRTYYQRLLIGAYVWRRLMLRTRIVAITGSVGKTTTTRCLAHVLAARYRTHATRENDNGRHGVLRTLLAMRPWHRYAVIEVGTDGPGMIGLQTRIVRPDVAIVLAVARAHVYAFSSLDAIAEEKSQLIRHLSSRGRAILNHDDARVRAMAGRCPAPITWFGSSEDCDVVTERVDASWPDRLNMVVRQREEPVTIQTQLVGRHWSSAVAAAVTAATLCDIPLAEAAVTLQSVAPARGRMQPMRLPNGAIVIRDEGVASPESMAALFDVMRDVRGYRRVLIAGDVTASTESIRKRQRAIGSTAAETCELAIFVGPTSEHAAKAAVAAGMDATHCWSFTDVRQVSALLQRELRAGDLVFVKGRGNEHLSRVVLAQFGNIGCWTDSCRLHDLCDRCHLLEPDFPVERTLTEAVRLVAANQQADSLR